MRLKLPSNVQFFLWELCNYLVLVYVVLKRRSMIVSDACPIYDGTNEDFLHYLFLYSCASEVWHRCLPHFLVPSANVDLKDWLKESINKHDIIINYYLEDLVFEEYIFV
ncbi:putative reverse transcriptase zinc-binding domain-containing protein [Medicago truncatula]|uniref:Putative reverse transcriptase zinc-binding domain-containing protein n=1 Tax=Medicago truncatula TaxID=3880 RepID=G7JKV4_MEDTR|nr:transmembrane protein, putative [Medicago truncatula]RHN60540.1 putative reverse transcriptase zinc-binding domain-containing protein [Medicago truncatula]